MQPEFIPFESDEELPNKRHRQSKDEQIYGIFTSKSSTQTPPKQPKAPKKLSENELGKTYGKGFSMLQKSGYKVGEGLGKNSQGTTEIIDVRVRRKNEGLSYSQPEMRPDHPKPEKKRKKEEKKNTVECSQANLEICKKISNCEDSLLALTYEEQQIERNLEELNSKALEISKILDLLKDCKEDWKSMIKAFEKIKSISVFHDLFIQESFVVPIFRGFFKEKWNSWNFCDAELEGIDEIRSWVQIGNVEDVIDIWETRVSLYFSQKWNPKEELGNSIDALELWKPLLPSATFSAISKSILLRISIEIDNWQPYSDRIAIHTWVLPWLGLIDLSSLYPKIIRRFEIALEKWQAKDKSAKLLLKPWKQVLNKQFDEFVSLHVLPKLLFFLQDFDVPEDYSQTKSIRCVLDWIGLIPFEFIADGFKNVFYPKWRKTLERVIEHNSDMDKVFEWFRYWENKIPAEILIFEI